MKNVTGVKNEISAGYHSSVIDNEDAIVAQAIQILENRYLRGQAITSSESCKDYLRLKFGELEHEIFALIHLDNQHRVIQVEELFRGTIDGASVYPREVVKSCLLKNSAAVIFCHNHPSGIATPSQSDISITKKLKNALDMVEIRVLDHVIVSQIETVSFSERGLL